MKRYKHLTPELRYHIWMRLQEKMSLSSIAREIKVSKSTITREINRNTGKKGYRYKQAQELANRRKQIKRYKKLDANLEAIIKKRISEQWSPEQLSGWLSLDDNNKSFSTESIYRYILRDKKRDQKKI